MRRVLAATMAVWAVLAVALVLVLSHRPAGAAQATQGTTVVLIRQPNGQLTLPAVTPATTQVAGAAGGGQAVSVTPSAQISASVTAPVSHATTRSS